MSQYQKEFKARRIIRVMGKVTKPKLLWALFVPVITGISALKLFARCLSMVLDGLISSALYQGNWLKLCSL